jgi:hypothetical protein
MPGRERFRPIAEPAGYAGDRRCRATRPARPVPFSPRHQVISSPTLISGFSPRSACAPPSRYRPCRDEYASARRICCAPRPALLACSSSVLVGIDRNTGPHGGVDANLSARRVVSAIAAVDCTCPARKLHGNCCFWAQIGVTRHSMSILVGLHHATRYDYDRPIGLGPQVVRLRPAPHCRTRIPSYSLTVTPAQHFVNWQQDPHGNWLARFVFPEKTTEFSVTVDLIADMEVINPFDFFVEPYADKWPFKFPPNCRRIFAAFVEPEPAGRAERIDRFDFARAAQHRRFSGRAQSAPAADDPLSHPHGAGRADARGDACLRRRLLPRHGLAAGAAPAPHRPAGAFRLRLSHPAAPDVKPLEGAAGAERLHRPACLDRGLSAGRGLDRARPTSGLLCGEGHLPVAATPHYRSAAPISGLVEPSEVTSRST